MKWQGWAAVICFAIAIIVVAVQAGIWTSRPRKARTMPCSNCQAGIHRHNEDGSCIIEGCLCTVSGQDVYYTTDDAAEMLGVQESTLLHSIKVGRFPATLVRDTYYVAGRSIDTRGGV